MDRQIITFEANEQTLIKTGGLDNYSSNKVSYIEAHFALGQNWAGYDSVRAVWSTRYECISTVLDTEGICVVPYEVLKWKDKVMVNLVGSISENNVLTDRITTYPIKALEVDADAKVCGSNTQPITPSEYEQFVEAVKADADRAEEAKEDARVYAGNALSSAQNALISETNASASEDNAKASELNAETYKNQAQTYAQNANNSAISAENAKDEAEDARDTILGMRAEATTLPEGSSATASYNDGVMSFGIPKGDTGATGATGETGATPQLSIGTVTTTTEPSVTITGTAENPVLNFGLVKGDKGDTGEVSLADLSTLLPTDTASGSIASFTDGQSVIPAVSVVADIEPIQDLHGYDKPWSGGAGKNKLNITYTTQTIDGVTITVNSDGVINCNGTASATILVPLGTVTTVGTFILNGCASGGSNDTWRLDVREGGVLAVDYGSGTSAYTSTATTTVYLRINNGAVLSNLKFYPMVRLSTETDATYAPYSNICPISGHDEVNVYVSPTTSETDATVYTTDLNGTIYGGTLDVVSGVLTVDMMYDQMTYAYLSGLSSSYLGLGSEQSTLGGATVFVRNWNYSIAEPRKAGGIEAYCNAFPVSMHDTNMFGSQNRTYFGIGSMTTVEEFLQAVQTLEQNGSGLFIAFKLATPQTIQLTPQEVQTLLGQNNVWNDCGDTEVTYKADVTKWVEKHLS